MRLNAARLLKRFFLISFVFIGCYFLVNVIFSLNLPIEPNKGRKADGQVAKSGLSLLSSSGHDLISYEDQKLMNEDAKRTGIGEQGHAVNLVGNEKEESMKFLNKNGFNTYISKRIALDRAIPDIRHPKCKSMLYSGKLPVVSIVIPFFEEDWSALFRTVVTAMKRAPDHLIKEVILVDDGSSRSYLKAPLDADITKHFPDGRVRVLHSPKREGLIGARITGARTATGDVLIFLDSHCEANYNWLPPLLHPIVEDYRTVVCPFIDVVSADTFEYRAQDEGARGAFDWELYYKRLPKLPQDEAYPERPFDSPVMAGGLFAISTKWFWELGGYDPGLAIWGGEQYELSFKLWMCGGRMIDVPCSRIGHIYRLHATDFPSAGKGDFLGVNYKRVAEVWMDEYKEHIYRRRPQYRTLDAGDLTEQKAIRERLKCKSFKWFMETIAFDLTKKYPIIDPIPAAVGDIRPIRGPSFCVDALGASQTVPIRLSKCTRDNPSLNGLQNFQLYFSNDIRPLKMADCWDLPNTMARAPIVLYGCHGNHGNQHFMLESVNNDKNNPVRIRHAPTNYCLEVDLRENTVYANPCSPKHPLQHWIWEKLQFDQAAESEKRAGV